MNKPLTVFFFPKVNNDSTRFMPYSVLQMERMIRNLNTDILFIDEQTVLNYELLIEKYADRIIMAVTTAATGFQIKGAIEFSQTIKKHNKNALTIWAGWHCSLMPELTLKEDYIDFIINGQAEVPFRELANAILNNKSFVHITGLGYKIENQIKINPKTGFVDIKDFPEINWSLINPSDYVFQNSFSERCITYFASHGCPFRCEFCSLATVFGGKWYNKDIETIINDIKYLKEKAHIDAISFWDDNFFTNKAHALKLSEAIISNNLNIKWECCTHAGLFNKLFNENDISLFFKSGLRQVFIGAESGDENILKTVNKNIQVDDNYLFVKNLKKHNISPVFLLIVCFPENPEKDLMNTLEMVRKSKIINSKLKIRLHLFVPVPQTKMYDVALEKGLVMPSKLSDYVFFLYRFKPPWISNNYSWKLELFVNFYLPLANPFLFKDAPTITFKILTALLSLFFFPITYLRFRLNYFRFPLEAYLFIYTLRWFNRIFKKKLTLNSESYLDKNNLGFYNSYCG
ncbi:MAG: radical SAM protein [Bacteroidales bacterium]|nr:radical SAM protein [Bacteroidales bacterium]